MDDQEGFNYPKVDLNKCINCGLCETICPHKNRLQPIKHCYQAYGLIYNKSEILSSSTSGGAFSALCKIFFELYPNGVVYGCVLIKKTDGNFVAKHVRATNLEECKQFRGSKYIQSEFWQIYDTIEEDLKNGVNVMCVGTPCQLAGVYKAFTKKYSESLFLVDILCHSVPSPLMFNEHIQALESLSGKQVMSYSFRPKTKGWRHYEEAYDCNGNIILKNRRQTQRHKELFYSEFISRPSCSQCKYTSEYSVSDVTLGDFWGVQKVNSKFYDKRGVSLVLIHTDKASYFFSKLQNMCSSIKVDDNVVIAHNHYKPNALNINRAAFWDKYYADGFNAAAKLYLDSNYVWFIKKIVRILLSERIRRIIKKILHVK